MKAQGFSCSLDGGLRISIFQFCVKKIFAVIFSSIFSHQNLGSGLDPDPYPDLDSLEMLDPDSYPDSDKNYSIKVFLGTAHSYLSGRSRKYNSHSIFSRSLS